MPLSSRGFSLIELLTVLFILSAISALGFYSARGILIRPRLKMQAEELLALLSSCEQQALERRERITVAFDASKKLIRAENAGAAERLFIKLPSGVELSRVSFGVGGKSAPMAIFYGNGVATAGTVVLADMEQRQCIIAQGIRGNRRLGCTE